MNDSMDAYLGYLKDRIAKLERRKGSVSEWRSAHAEFNRALDFARREGQTIRFALPEATARDQEKRVEARAKELWLEGNSDDPEWAENAWAEMTSPDDWSPQALALLEEARSMMMDKEEN